MPGYLVLYVLVFLFKKNEGVIALASQAQFAEGVRMYGRCRWHCGHSHDTAMATIDGLADGKADIALLAREILYNPYFAIRANSALLRLAI